MIRLFIGSFLLGVLCATAQNEQDSAACPEELIENLSHEDFAVRKAATAELKESGIAAVPLVVAAALGNEPEAVVRAREILVAFVDSFEAELVKRTLVALESEVERGNVRAKKVAAVVIGGRRNRSAKYLSERGLPIKQDLKEILRVRIEDEWKGTVEDLQHLFRFPELESFNVSHTNLGDEVMDLIPRFPNVKKLRLGYSKITGAGLAQLKKTTSVDYLSLEGLKIGNDAGAVVASMTGLKHLGFDYTEMNDGALVHVKNLKKLETLWLNGLEIKGPGLKHLEGLPNLNKLIFAKSSFGDEGMPHLGKLTQVRQLGLDDTEVTDAGMVHLKGMTSLEKLWLNRAEVSDAAISDLGKLKSLEMLYVGDTKITAAGVKKLQELLPECEVTLD